MSKIWFSSDHHDSHFRILELSGRPWKDCQSMREALLKNINDAIAEDDIFYMLGDTALGKKSNYWEFIDGIRCKNIHHILGNHDARTFIIGSNEERKRLLSISKRVDTAFYYKGKVYNFTLTHIPIDEDKRLDSRIYLAGHWHSKKLQHDKNFFEVGVDSTEYKPISLDTIIDMYENWVPPRPRKGH